VQNGICANTGFQPLARHIEKNESKQYINIYIHRKRERERERERDKEKERVPIFSLAKNKE